MDNHQKPSHPKPRLSYANLITLALKNSPNGSRSVKELYKFMADNFPYFKTSSMYVWKNSVRHTLSLHKAFKKVKRAEVDVNGIKQGCLWTINPNKMEKEHMELLQAINKGILIIFSAF